MVAELGLHGPFALVTAGWKEREGEVAELEGAIGGNAFNLELNRCYERVLDKDPELGRALRRRQDRLRELQELYRLQLANAMASARKLMATDRAPEIIDAARDHAIEAVRQLDRHHLSRVADMHRLFESEARPGESRALLGERSQLAQRVHDAQAVLIAGGHIAVLLNRLRLFDLAPALRQGVVIAWSAGAMAVCGRVVLFHDSPPQGPGNAEVLDRGLELASGVLPLPNASERLELGNATRVALLARRFAELVPVVLDPGARLDWDPPRWRACPGTRVLGTRGTLDAWEAA